MFDLHVCIYILEQAEPCRSGRITVYHSDVVILEIIKHTVNDLHVPACEHKIMAAIQLIIVKVKGIDHACIYSQVQCESLTGCLPTSLQPVPILGFEFPRYQCCLYMVCKHIHSEMITPRALGL